LFKVYSSYYVIILSVEQQTRDLTVTAIDFKITQSGGDNRKEFHSRCCRI